MVKNIRSSGAGTSPQINEGDLAAHQREITALLGNLFELEHNHYPEVYFEADKDKLFPETPILAALKKNLESSTVKLRIPGHSQGEGILPQLKEVLGYKVLKADTTDDFDGLGQLHPPKGPIKEAQELAAKAFGAEHTFFLVNGSTVGNLALALTVTKPGEKVIVARNCHRSVISGIATSGAIPVWAIPERDDEWGIWGKITPDQIEKLLIENPEATTVWVTNPTYEGVVSDLEAIAKICKKHDVILLVDEAHGSHWNFNHRLPNSSLTFGADAVVHSIHKTAGSFSQSSMLHLSYSSRIDYDELLCNLRMLQSTSPSYTLLASLDAARAYIDSIPGRAKLDQMVKVANEVREKMNKIPGCKCLNSEHNQQIDPTKVYMTMEGLTGEQLKDILEFEFHIEIEARTDKGILALANIGNTVLELDYFLGAIKNIASRRQYYFKSNDEGVTHMPFSIPEMVCIPREAYFCRKTKVLPAEAVGKVSAEIIAVCPPGIPILVPGEKIQREHLKYLDEKEFIWVKSEETNPKGNLYKLS